MNPDRRRFVTGAAGGVGTAAIQIAKAAGAKVIAAASSDEKCELCRQIGADATINYATQNLRDELKVLTEGKGPDVVYDPVGGDTFDRSTKCIAFEGRILVIGFTGGRFAEARTNHALIKNYSVVGVHWGLYNTKQPERIREIHGDLVDLHARGAIRPLVHEVITLDEVPAALTRLASRGTTGKVVWAR